MYTKKHLKTTQKQRGTPSTAPLARTQPLYKVYKGKRTTNYVQLAPGPNITNEEEFQPLNQLSLIVKCPTIFFPSKQSKKGIKEQPATPISFSYPQKNHVILTKPL